MGVAFVGESHMLGGKCPLTKSDITPTLARFQKQTSANLYFFPLQVTS